MHMSEIAVLGDYVRICLWLKPFDWVSSEIPEMSCVRSAQQWYPKQAQRARASAPRLSRPSFTFRLSPPHFRITHLYSAGIRCGKRPHYIVACHFVDVLDPCLLISQ